MPKPETWASSTRHHDFHDLALSVSSVSIRHPTRQQNRTLWCSLTALCSLPTSVPLPMCFPPSGTSCQALSRTLKHHSNPMCHYFCAAFPDHPQPQSDSPRLISFYVQATAHITEMTALSLASHLYPLYLTVWLWKSGTVPFMSVGILFTYIQERRVSLGEQINLSRVLHGMRRFQNSQSEWMTNLIIFSSLFLL